MSTYEKRAPGKNKPQTTPAQPSTDPQEDKNEQGTGKEMPDIEHQHEIKNPSGPKQGGNEKGK